MWKRFLNAYKFYRTNYSLLGAKMDKWKCTKCNYIFAGRECPKICPNCGHKTEFEFFEDLIPPFTRLYDE